MLPLAKYGIAYEIMSSISTKKMLFDISVNR